MDQIEQIRDINDHQRSPPSLGGIIGWLWWFREGRQCLGEGGDMNQRIFLSFNFSFCTFREKQHLLLSMLCILEGKLSFFCLWAVLGKGRGRGAGEGSCPRLLGRGAAVTLWPSEFDQFSGPWPWHSGTSGLLCSAGPAGRPYLGLGCRLRSTSGFSWPAVQFQFYLIAVGA